MNTPPPLPRVKSFKFHILRWTGFLMIPLTTLYDEYPSPLPFMSSLCMYSFMYSRLLLRSISGVCSHPEQFSKLVRSWAAAVCCLQYDRQRSTAIREDGVQRWRLGKNSARDGKRPVQPGNILWSSFMIQKA